MLLKSRYVQIREIEKRMETDALLPPKTGIFYRFRLNDYYWRQAHRMMRIIQLKYMIEHDYEDLVKLK